MPAHTIRKAAVKAGVGMVLLAAASFGLYQGAGAIVRASQPDQTTYVSRSSIDHRLAMADHTPASKAGAFLPSASIATGDVTVDLHMIEVP